jgi:NADH:ubiquinone oxidoreductase subunit 5 (subunit L)/multisubunit Na+/H+ antiporter MnhA subunit
LVFSGKSRDTILISAARERAGLWGPMLALLVPVAIAGFAMNIPELLGSSISESRTLCDELAQKIWPKRSTPILPFDQAWPVQTNAAPAPGALETIDTLPPDMSPAAVSHDRGAKLQHRWFMAAWIIGLVFGVGFYARGLGPARRVVQFPPTRWLHAWLRDGMYFNELYFWTIGRFSIMVGGFLASIDRLVLQGLIRRSVYAIRRKILELRYSLAKYV